MMNVLLKPDLEEELKNLKEIGAAMSRVPFRNRDGTMKGAVIFVQGEPETSRILKAIEKEESKWRPTDR